MRLGWVDDELFFEHAAPAGHPEREERLLAVRRGLESSRVRLQKLPAADATIEQLKRVHSGAHVEYMQHIAGSAGYIDADTYYCPDTYNAIMRASGGCVQLVQRLLSGDLDYGFAAVRPPGHHACRDRAMGFCLVNHVAVAAAEALQSGLERVLILDWDVHHGNGTEDIFYEQAQVLYVSLHQSPQYPGTGRVRDVGKGDGQGFNLNLPLSAGADDAVYVRAFSELVCPVVAQFKPQLTIVSAGYDAHQRDPLGGMAVTDDGYAAMTELLLRELPERGQGSTCFVLEGGYDLQALEGASRATVETLLGPIDVPDGEVGSRYATEIEQARLAQSKFWNL